MKLGYVIVYVPDVAAAVAFYGRAFGLVARFADPSGVYAEMETGETALAFAAEQFVAENDVPFRPHRTGERPAATEIGFVVADVEEAVARAAREGAELVKAPVRKPWGQVVAYVRDLNGVLVELCTAVG